MTKQEILDLNLKHGEAISEFFEGVYESWMNEKDKSDFVNLLLNTQNKTIQDLDNDLEIGVQNGYSVEEQFEIVKKIFSR